MRDTVCLVGFASNTMKFYKQERRKADIWSVNFAVTKHKISPLKVLLELHDTNSLSKHPSFREHWKWLQKPHSFPIYMQEPHPLVPSAVKYPYEEACELTKGLIKGGESVKYFTSSFDFLMALAILKGYENIKVYGYEMATETEYAYQRPGQTFWVGLALGLGKTVTFHENSEVFKSKVYAYEGSQMISRQALEKLKQDLETQLNQTLGKQNHLGGQITEKLSSKQDATKLQEEYVKTDQQTHMISGGLRVVEILIRQCDLLETDSTLISNIEQKKVDQIEVKQP